MGAFVVSDQIMQALKELPSDARFMHAYTNSAHPTAAAVALRNLKIIDDEQLIENGRVMGDRLGKGLQSALGTHAHVMNLRNLGLMAGLSLVEDVDQGTAYDSTASVGGKVARHMREQGGVITRFVGDHIVLAPPLVISSDEVDQIIDALEAAVHEVTGD